MAAASSTAVAAPPPPFPTAFEKEEINFLCRSQAYRAIVVAVHHGPTVATAILKIGGKTPKRAFEIGEPAVLQSVDGGRWAGVIADPGDARLGSCYTWIDVDIPHELPAGDLILRNDSFLSIYTFQHKPHLHSTPVFNSWFMVDFSMDENNLHTDSKASVKAKPKTEALKLKVGVIGFGAIGRQVVETLADAQDVELLAIVDNATVPDMVMAWKSSKFGIRGFGEKAVLFKRKIPELDKNDDIIVTVFSCREHRKDPWSKLSVGYVVDTLNLFTEDNKRITYWSHNWIDQAPEENQLPEGNRIAYTMVCDDKGVFNCFGLHVKYMKIMTSAVEVNEALYESFPEWREGSVNLCFCAETDPTMRICDPLTELPSNDDEEEANEKQAGGRLISLLSCCVRILRRAAIGGVFLMI